VYKVSSSFTRSTKMFLFLRGNHWTRLWIVYAADDSLCPDTIQHIDTLSLYHAFLSMRMRDSIQMAYLLLGRSHSLLV